MAMMSDAIGKIRGIASTYLSHPTMLRAKSVAMGLARNPSLQAGAAIGVGAVAAAQIPSAYRNYRNRRAQGQGTIRSAMGGSIGGMRGIGQRAAGLGIGAAAGYAYGKFGGYGGMKSAAMGMGAKAARWGAGVTGRMASAIGY